MKLKRLTALVMSIALTSASYPSVDVAAQVAGNISGTLVRSEGTAVAGACVRLRNMNSNAIVAGTVSAPNGAFSFSAAQPGMYVVEVTDCADGRVLAVSEALNLTSAALTLNTLVVLPSVVAAGFFTSTAFIVLAAASAAGVTVFAIKAGGPAPAVSSPEQ